MAADTGTRALVRFSSGTLASRSEISSIQRTRESVEKRRDRVLALQNRVAQIDARVDEALASVKQARERALDRLLVRDSPPIWRINLRPNDPTLAQQTQLSFSAQVNALRAYVERQPEKLFIHVAVMAFLVAAFFWIRLRVRPWIKDEPGIAHAAGIFNVPIATALVVSVFAAGRIYSEAPRLWWHSWVRRL